MIAAIAEGMRKEKKPRIKLAMAVDCQSIRSPADNSPQAIDAALNSGEGDSGDGHIMRHVGKRECVLRVGLPDELTDHKDMIQRGIRRHWPSALQSSGFRKCAPAWPLRNKAIA